MENIKWELVSSLTLPPDAFQPFIDEVYNKFGDYSKLAINSFIGCFNRKSSVQVTSKFTRSEKEACYAYTNYKAKFVKYIEELEMYQVINEENISFDESCSPLYLQI